MPAISVIVPVYKVEKYIHRCVDSILGQTFTDFELILVDDGSPDSCGTICDEYAARDSRVVVIHQENGGLSVARNAGIDWAFANSDSQWLTFIDSDDWVHPEYLQRHWDAVVEHNVSVSICGYVQTTGEALKVDPETLTPVLWTPEEFYVAHNVNAIVAWGKLYSKECFRTIRYPVGKIHEDEFVTYRIIFPLEKVACIPAGLYAYYQNPEGITKSPWTPRRLDVIAALEEQRAFFRQKGFTRAYKTATEGYFTCLSRANKVLDEQENTAEIRKMRKMIQRKLATFMWENRKEYPVGKKNLWRYELAFPKLMWVYWTAVGIGNKLKKG